MTEQPKFQRRKRRGSAADAVSPAARTPSRPEETADQVKALLAEKEALLQRMAELEAEQRRGKATAEQKRVPEAKVEPVEPVAKPAQTAKPPRQQTAKPLVLAKPPAPPVAKPEKPDPELHWNALDRFRLDPERLDARHVITALRQDPAHTRFDILRTRMLQALAENGWKRVAITSPTKDCGKTFTAANLAISLSRQEQCRTVLLDLDMRSPSLHKIFGVSDPGSIGDLLRGEILPERHLQGFAPNSISAGSHVAIGFNGLVEPYAAELLQDQSTADVLNDIETVFNPTVMLFDLPPALLNDDVIAMRPHFDALLIVAGGGITRANDIKETERRLGQGVPLLGVVLNKAEQSDSSEYVY